MNCFVTTHQTLNNTFVAKWFMEKTNRQVVDLGAGFQKLEICRPTHKFLQTDQDTMTMIFLTRTITPVFLVSTGVR